MSAPTPVTRPVADSERTRGLQSWDDAGWRGLRVVVTGLGVSGFSAADTLVELGAVVVVVDGRDSPENRAKADTLRIVGVADVLLSEEAATTLPLVAGEPADLVVTSPGWRPDQPLLMAAHAAGLPIWSDVELAWRLRERAGRTPAEWVCLTGTNGKTTTVTMVEAILRADGRRAIACGNVGTPVLDAIRDPEGYDVLALELSSFQLHWTHGLAPASSAVLNVAEDHVDWHGSMEEYAAAKGRVYENTRVACVFNEHDPLTRALVERADVQEGCRAVGFTTDTPGLSDVGVVDGILVDRAFVENRRHEAVALAERSDLGPVAPRHTVANAAAAAALTRAVGVAPEAVAAGLRAYDRGEHRIQLVATSRDVMWINDSKATNPHAADASLAAFTSIVWIAGGLPKGVTYDELVAAHAGRLRAVVLLGRDTAPLRAALAAHAPDVPVHAPLTDVEGTGSEDGAAVMAAAVRLADELARPGDTVLMAPAAASMDQFRSYAQRGEAFIDAVAALMREHGWDVDAD
ncbi:UDP-N-acetylmuramoyl-L-alanine--D-glutamate ligase [Micrococcus sp.]|uniref:UDP-N-acetylmuramoyl-L-alanine--D-glutamate ligase n=1 Tax=Micrococcus sp. TaxID=1271 RepID=UPI002A91AEC8|nr:UDP-N-acetylmuramoyl-L-alanine--D-glutamate ligase [Micrococcus sp.]MDY6055564.1 UDP-N-acetylmuramoyl-L-alanine--D-glutamate ligase [Micrococcus sp.]